MGKITPKSSYKNLQAAAKSTQFFVAKQAAKKTNLKTQKPK
ncbi:MAG: hypothetical protein K0Q77_2407 [Anaerosporomusa subterranea]|jgi:hypothetical protein|nr:hypothetical protein [Anaerosporomusa subterranea]